MFPTSRPPRASFTSRTNWAHGVEVLTDCTFELAACDECDRCNCYGGEVKISADWPLNHSDRGVPCARLELFEEHGMAQSMSRGSNCYDNAMMESLCGDRLRRDSAPLARPHAPRGACGKFLLDRHVVPTNQNPQITGIRQPRSVQGDREGRSRSLSAFMIGVQVHPPSCNIAATHSRFSR